MRKILFKDPAALTTMTELEEKHGATVSGKRSQSNTMDFMIGATSLFARLAFSARSTSLLCHKIRKTSS